MEKYMLKERTVPGLHAHLVGKIETVSKDMRILDLGCGTGAWLNRLRDNGYSNLAGADIDISQIGMPDLKVFHINLDGDGLNSIDGQYDLISAIEFVEHLGDVSNLLNFVHERLSDGGSFLLSTPNVNSLTSRIKLAVTGKLRHFDQYGDQTHYTPIFIEPFARLLAKHGLTIKAVWTYPEAETRFGSRGLAKASIGLARLFFSDPFPGDVICFLIERKMK